MVVGVVLLYWIWQWLRASPNTERSGQRKHWTRLRREWAFLSVALCRHWTQALLYNFLLLRPLACHDPPFCHLYLKTHSMFLVPFDVPILVRLLYILVVSFPHAKKYFLIWEPKCINLKRFWLSTYSSFRAIFSYKHNPIHSANLIVCLAPLSAICSVTHINRKFVVVKNYVTI